MKKCLSCANLIGWMDHGHSGLKTIHVQGTRVWRVRKVSMNVFANTEKNQPPMHNWRICARWHTLGHTQASLNNNSLRVQFQNYRTFLIGHN